MHDQAHDTDECNRQSRSGRRRTEASRIGAKREDNECDLESLEEDALERHNESGPVEYATGRRYSFELSQFLLEQSALVPHCLPSRRTEDRLAHPLQPEDHEQRADDDAESLDGDVVDQRRSERTHHYRERDERREDAGERGSPVVRQTDGQHDRECLYHLHRGGEERGADENQRVKRSAQLNAELFARLYGCSVASVRYFECDNALAFKFSIPRPIAEGDLGDGDLHGGQQFAPLIAIEVP
jgi:Domain of unknown function (DUF4387)